MHFAHPNVLWLLLVVPPAMLGFYFWSARKRKELIAKFIQARLLTSLVSGHSDTRRAIRFGLFVAAVSLVIVALARPQWGFTWEEVKQRGLDIVVAIDISKSMLADDVQPNRLARAKLAAMDLMQQAKSDRLGLVGFAGSAFLQCPLTVDSSVFRQSLENLDVNTISQGGTAISAAIESAMGAFADDNNYKILVIFTDGEDHDSGALETAQQAAAKGLEIFTLGVGTSEGQLLRIKDATGKLDFVRDENGNVVKTKLNEQILQQLAGTSRRGFYLPLVGPKAIDTLYAKGLAPIPKSESAEKFVKQYHERFRWPLGAAIILFVIEILLPERKRMRHRARAEQTFPRVKTAALSLALCAVIPLSATASPRSALKDYQKGDYAESLKEYKNLLRKKPNDSKLHFNAGAAAYKEKDFEEATKHFGEATASQDLALQEKAYFNRGNAAFKLGENIPEPNKKNELWQKALQDFESALKLNDKDRDAAFNRDYVKRKLEELQQQQQQDQNKQDQSKQDQNKKDQNKGDQNQQQPQDQKNQQKDQGQQDQKQSPGQKDQNQDQKQQQQDPSKQNPQKEPQQQKDQPRKSEGDRKQEPSKKPGEDTSESDQQPQDEQQVPGQMTPSQARQLLDAEKGEEKMLQLQPKEQAGRGRRLRDW